ncbi:MAG: response regulator [Candidatus Heimdallarchaeaceae archaeon]
MATIFVIEDEETIQFLYKESLQLAGHKIVGSANNGVEAIRQISSMKRTPDVIILDHRMPIKSGLDTLREIKRYKLVNKSKIIFITADPTVRKEVGELGVSLFIQKPFSVLKLGALISNLTK